MASGRVHAKLQLAWMNVAVPWETHLLNDFGGRQHRSASIQKHPAPAKHCIVGPTITFGITMKSFGICRFIKFPPRRYPLQDESTVEFAACF